MSEFNLKFSKFNSIVNPENKAIYFYTVETQDYTLKYALRHKIPVYYTADEFLASMQDYRNLKINLGETEFLYIDIDTQEAYNYLVDKLQGLNYILVSSLAEHHYHIYMKKPPEARWLHNPIGYSIHDYYIPNSLAPYAPVLPRPENGRTFVNIPDTVDYMPANLITEELL